MHTCSLHGLNASLVPSIVVEVDTAASQNCGTLLSNPGPGGLITKAITTVGFLSKTLWEAGPACRGRHAGQRPEANRPQGSQKRLGVRGSGTRLFLECRAQTFEQMTMTAMMVVIVIARIAARRALSLLWLVPTYTTARNLTEF